MLGISYGELFLLLGATAALIGPKDLPRIARTAGRLAGRAIGYVQLGRGQLENVLQQSQASQVHKELQDTMAQLEAIRYEIRSISMINPGPLTRRLDNPESTSAVSGNSLPEKPDEEQGPTNTISKVFHSSLSQECSSTSSTAANLQSQAAAYARLAESSTLSSGDVEKLKAEVGLLAVLPVSAESTGLLPKRTGYWEWISDSESGLFATPTKTTLRYWVICDCDAKLNLMAQVKFELDQNRHEIV
ncbi:hypothetical protein BVC80_1649g34 [Macleaya cordata]|uniref:Sec-independent protein translocase protein TatB n=1 Tax=Macleaya cordata TaxID=56857 RepID=A0A200PSN1_MACCD|nr:hypothetical protein BVC80_1649g34 [Macleaya cordata]